MIIAFIAKFSMYTKYSNPSKLYGFKITNVDRKFNIGQALTPRVNKKQRVDWPAVCLDF